MKIYFCGSIRGGRQDCEIYQELIAYLKKFGTVLTEHIGNPEITNSGELLAEKEIHDRDIAWLCQSDCIVAEVTVPSLGVGYEIGRAVEQKKPILCLYRPSDEKKASAMLLGQPKITMHQYTHMTEAKKHIDLFFSKKK